MQLKKINQDHYVVVTDEPIKEDCYALHISPLGEEEIVTANGECKLDKKITHSTQPIEDVMGLTNELNAKGWVNVKMIDLSYIKSLVGEVDVEKMADRYSEIQLKGMADKSSKFECINDFITGYQQCLEDNKDKRFSEEDLRNIARFFYNYKVNVGRELFNKDIDLFISSLTQPKDTWDVEFDENNNLKLK